MRNYVQRGESLDLTAPSGGVVAGTLYKIGSLIVCAMVSAAAGASFSGLHEGVIDATAEGAGSGQAWAEGDLLYYDATNKRLTKTSTSNTLCAVAVAAKLTAATTGRAKLIPTI